MNVDYKRASARGDSYRLDVAENIGYAKQFSFPITASGQARHMPDFLSNKTKKSKIVPSVDIDYIVVQRLCQHKILWF
jgi:hypothetical protein